MTTRSTLAIVACAAALALWSSVAFAKKTPCAGGRFRPSAALLGEGAVQSLVVEAGTVAIEGVCPPVPAVVKGSERKTTVKASWPPSACTGIDVTVKLKGKIVSSCGRLNGKLKAKGAQPPRKFQAPLSTCGDGVIDAGAGEACESAADCTAPEPCTVCNCGTSTTISTTPTTSTSVTTTTFSGALAPDYVMFSGAETGTRFEPSLLNGCSEVQSPVRTGRFACEITQGFFFPLRPEMFAHESLFARVYHRIEVTTPPTSEAFAPVVVTDVNPQGITAADVGVRPDGTIRYRLRDRLNGIDLGFSDPMPSGQWVQLELFTVIGAGTGAAEMRINGATAVAVQNQNFGITPLDTIFLSNNPNQYAGANGGIWRGFFDDVAITLNNWPGAGRVIARQGKAGTPTYGQWNVVNAPDVSTAWSQTPFNPASRAETPAVGDPLAQTMLVAPFDQGVDAIAPGNTIKACQTWTRFAVIGAVEDRVWAIRRRVAGVDVDTQVVDLLPGPKLRSDALEGAFWRATLPELNAAEIGGVKSGGAGGSGLGIEDAWLICEYQ